MLFKILHMLLKAKQEKFAIGAFNVYNLEGALAVIQAAQEMRSPVMLQILPQALALGKTPLIRLCLDAGKKASIPVAVHLDHCSSKSQIEMALDFDRLAAIKKSVRVPLVLHGTSGLPDEMIQKAIERGICKFNVNTEVRSAYPQSLRHAFIEGKSHELIDIMQEGIRAMTQPVKEKIRLFGSSHKAV